MIPGFIILKSYFDIIEVTSFELVHVWETKDDITSISIHEAYAKAYSRRSRPLINFDR